MCMASPRWLWRLAPSLLVLLLALTRGALLRPLAHALLWTLARLVHVAVLASGGLTFWGVLRFYQLRYELEIVEAATQRHAFAQRYRARQYPSSGGSGSGSAGGGKSGAISPDPFGALAFKPPGMADAGFQLKVVKRLPIETHLRTSWSLPLEICDEISAFVALAVREYVAYWFQPISSNDDFPRDVRFFLADCLGALAARVLEIDSSQALTVVARALELLRLHLAWFREAFAQLSDEHPAVFRADADSNDDALLQRRQELLAALAQRSPLLHPACAAPASSAKQHATPEHQYLRHVATQCLLQLRPELAAQIDANIVVSMVFHMLRESLAFKGIQPMLEYALPRYSNELVATLLQSLDVESPTSPPSTPSAAAAAATATTATTAGLGFNVPLPRQLQRTKSFLYQATKRSTEPAEAALQAALDSAGKPATPASPSAASPVAAAPPPELLFGEDFWSESSAFGLVSPRSPTAAPLSPTAPAPGSSTSSAAAAGERKSHFASLFSLDDRLPFPKSTRLGRSSPPMSRESAAPASTHMDDLKHMKANLESSLNSSLFKVKKTFRNLGGHLQDPLAGVPTTTAREAANLMKRPGRFLQKALRRGDPTAPPQQLPVSPRSPTQVAPTPTSTSTSTSTAASTTGTATSAALSLDLQMQQRVLQLLDKTVGSYVRLWQERPEMRSSARSRELYELLSALEDVFMLGYRHDVAAESDEGDGEWPLRDPAQLYWNYLAQDRPETPFLNAHWQFVATQCPPCVESESFYSTRGVQWILVALERGLLWDLLTALQLGRRATAFFYDDTAVLRNGRAVETMLKCVLQLNKLRVALEIPQLLGRAEVDEELRVAAGLSPRASRSSSTGSAASAVSSSSSMSSASVVRVVETVWEVERYVPIHGWVKAPDKRASKELPSSEWIWENDWTLEASAASLDELLSDDGLAWEYANSLDDRFHDKQKKLDSVRRRKWTRRRRQLPPVLSLCVSPTAAGTPRASWSMQQQQQQQRASSPTRRPSSRHASWDEDDVDALRRQSARLDSSSSSASGSGGVVKRRSFHLERSDSRESVDPFAAAALLLQQQQQPPQLRKRRSSDVVALSESTSPRSRRAISDDSGSVLAADDDDDGGEDDDGNLCFRCFKALHRRSSSGVISGGETCQSCHQRVCAPCHAFFAFLVYPPPLETSKKEQVCGSCYERIVGRYRLRVSARVGKYFVKDSEGSSSNSSTCMAAAATGTTGVTAPSSNGSSNKDGGSNGSLTSSATGAESFEITVQLQDDSAYAWSVVKTFHDFEVLEKRLYDKLKKQEKKHNAGVTRARHRHWKGVDYSEVLLVEPCLRNLPAATAAALTYDKRRYLLDEFLQHLLATDTLCRSSAVQEFLLLGTAGGSSTGPSVSGGAGAVHASASAAAAGGGAGAGQGSSGPPSSSGSAAASANETGASGDSVSASRNPAMLEQGKWRKGKWVAAETKSKETKMRVLQRLEVSLFAVANELLELDGVSLLRRHLFSMTRSFIKAFLNASHFRRLEKQYLSFTDPRRMATMIASFREYMFPDPSTPPPPPPPATLSATEMRTLRRASLNALLASVPSTMISVVGETPSENAALKLHEFLQHEVFVKNLAFSVADEVLQQLFPDMVPFTRKVKAKTS
ncbi:hypothetical protein P43SY_003582 [Pythium insidiosum]|uniref:PX domain-containing protein n=1 Tax=Pythium insidiosum TaxID=114742 RepID=A0AAD5M3L4_PYTIN|nr:hypothetical protein P43SY_003582 [Pythium insidiosum]